MGVLPLETQEQCNVVKAVRRKFEAAHPDILVELEEMSPINCPRCRRQCVKVKATAKKMKTAVADICPVCLKSSP